LQLSDDYKTRNDIMGQLYRNANSWFELALTRAPIELQSTLQVRDYHSHVSFWLNVINQKYLAVNQPSSGSDSLDLGPSIAEHFGKAIGPIQRSLSKSAFLYVATLFT
jgi:phosphatidylinositol 4-kinase A